MKLFLKILEGIGYWVMMCLLLFCVGGICTFLYQCFGKVSLDGENFLVYIWDKGLFLLVL